MSKNDFLDQRNVSEFVSNTQSFIAPFTRAQIDKDNANNQLCSEYDP